MRETRRRLRFSVYGWLCGRSLGALDGFKYRSQYCRRCKDSWYTAYDTVRAWVVPIFSESFWSGPHILESHRYGEGAPTGRKQFLKEKTQSDDLMSRNSPWFSECAADLILSSESESNSVEDPPRVQGTTKVLTEFSVLLTSFVNDRKMQKVAEDHTGTSVLFATSNK